MLVILLIAIAAMLADQVTKLLTVGFFVDPERMLVTGLLHEPGDSVTLIPDVFSFTYVLNKGAAFGILQNQRFFFLIVTVAICAVGTVLLLRIKKKHWVLKLVSGLIFGGALGNLIDRLVIGSVRDFLDASFVQTITGYAFPVFNLADMCVVVGTVLLAIYILFLHEKQIKQDGKP